jgi:hypothetical protein
MPSKPSNPVVSLIAAIALALCAGALWSLVSLVLRGDAAWMAAPAALVAVIGAGFIKSAHRAVAATLALALTLLAAVYALYLNAATLIATRLGLDLGTALRDIGPEMATALMRARLDATDFSLIGGSALLAGAIAWRRAARRALR